MVHAGLRLGLRIRYRPSGALGADRLAAVVAARHFYGAPVLAVTLGTATKTFNLVSPAGDFAGGAIAPGLVMSAEALRRSTARLPLVDLVAPPRVIGRNTDESVRAGVMYGFAGLVEGMVHRLKATIGTPGDGTPGQGFPVVATGGLARVLAPLTAAIDVVDEGLILEGLRLVWEMNP